MELLNTVHSILYSPRAYLHHSREVISFLHSVLLFLIRHVNTLRLNSVLYDVNIFRHLSQKQYCVGKFLWAGGREKAYFNDHLTLAVICFPNWTPCLIPRVTSIHVLHLLYHPDASWIIYNNKIHRFSRLPAAKVSQTTPTAIM